MSGRDPVGFIITIVRGIAASVVVGYIGRPLYFYQDGHVAGFLASVIVWAIVLLVVDRAVIGKTGCTN